MTLAWPEGVIARCLAPGGATTDVIHVAEDNSQYGGVSHSVRGECTGELCDASHQSAPHTYRRGFDPLGDEGFQYAINNAREWAENHSKTCRWVPKPRA